MKEPTSGNAIEVLQNLHQQLDLGFRALHASRELLTPAAPVFTLEHGLSDADLELLKEAVRSVAQQGFHGPYRESWLPFVVYAAESGYNYAGGEYWQTFADSTPGWHKYGERAWIREWFQRFADDYGGARPKGAFARRFRIIAWPITHAVLPVYLQRHLAHLLYGFRTGLTTQLLQDPGALGERLAARAGSYPERFRYFCQNTILLGQVSVALLSGEEEESPYLLRPTLHRLVAGLSREHQSRQWLTTARGAAGQVRSKTQGFIPEPHKTTPRSKGESLPRPTDPCLLLRRAGNAWRAFVELPDFSSLITRLPQLSDEFRNRRPGIAGAERRYLARRQLLFPGQEVKLARWPRAQEPFIHLERAAESVNHLLADQCAINAGPIWLFRLRAQGLAVEVKGRTVRPGCSYVLVTDAERPMFAFPAVTEVPIEAAGVRAFYFTVPDIVSGSHAAAFAAAGVSLVADVVIRPVGVAAAAWDGEGVAEWLAGEPGMISIRSEQGPETCTVTFEGWSQTLLWPRGQRDLLLRLDDLSVGTSRVDIALIADSSKTIAEGHIDIAVRDPKVRPDTATAGEGIRMLTDPAQPTLGDLWDDRVEISIDGPASSPAILTVILYSDSGEKLSEIAQEIRLPIAAEDWSRTAAGIRSDQRFKGYYDEAQSTSITVSQSGIGFATLTCERGFQPLQWRFIGSRNGSYVARLIDRTDGAQTVAEMFTVDEPIVPIKFPPSEDISIPAKGGLLRATAGEATALALLPTQPTRIMGHGNTVPVVRANSRSSGEVIRLAVAHLEWETAHRPADPFALRQCHLVLEAIAREIASLVGKVYWARIERKMRNASDLTEYIDEMRSSVGITSSHRELADRIARSLWHWSTVEAIRAGFFEALADTVKARDAEGYARFALTLADQPGQILVDWSPDECADLLVRVLMSPVILRAARFTLIGARALHAPAVIRGPW